ncbi:MAG: heme-binding domain-containing protein [Halarcobacter sp.]
MKKTLLIIVSIFLLAQLIQTEKINKPTPKELEIKAPEHIMTMLKKACYDCHSNKVRWPWYSNIAPFSWMIDSHVNDGRSALNFSEWENYTEKEKKKELKEIFRTAYISMPLKDYIIFHEEADLTREERTQIRDWTGVKK